MVDEADSKSAAERLTGSSPVSPTNTKEAWCNGSTADLYPVSPRLGRGPGSNPGASTSVPVAQLDRVADF